MGVLAVVLIASILGALFFLGFAMYSALTLILVPPLAALATAVVFLAVALQVGYVLQNKVAVLKREMRRKIDAKLNAASSTAAAAPLGLVVNLLPNLALGLLAKKPVLGLGLGAIALMLLSKSRQHKA